MLTKDELSKIGIGVGLNVPIVREDWDTYFLSLCEKVSTRSPDSNTKFGAIFTRKNRIVAVGYNGFPPDSDDNELPNSRDPNGHKYKAVVHAETNAIYYAARNGVALDNCKLYVQGHPCSECCKALLSVNVKDWVIGTRSHVVNESERLWMRYWTEHYNVNIKVVKTES